MNQMTINHNRNGSSQKQQNTYQAAPVSGFTKNSNSGNIIAHDIIEVRKPSGSTLQNNGNEIFNSGGYGGSQKSMQEAKFEQSFQKPMADRNRSLGGNDLMNNYQHMRPAGGAINIDPTTRKVTIDDGKSRLFGMGDENAMPVGQQAVAMNKNTGKKILHAGSSANTYSNVIGGSYVADGYENLPPSSKAVKYMSGPGLGVNPITSHNVDQYYPSAAMHGRDGGAY